MSPSPASGRGRASTLVVKSYHDFAQGPPAEEEGKFVLLTKGKGLHLVLSPVALTPYHANIVYQYLQAEGRGEVEAVGSGGCHILSKAWKVHGGGYYTLQTWLHNLLLQGKSTAFGKYELSLLAPFIDEIPKALGLEGYTLECK